MGVVRDFPSVSPASLALLGRFLRELRERNGLALRGAAQAVNRLHGVSLTDSKLHRLETGQARLDIGQLRALAQVYRSSVQEFEDHLLIPTLVPQVDLLGSAAAHKEAGRAALEVDQPDTALAHYLAMWAKAETDFDRCLARNNQGLSLWRMGKWDLACRILSRAVNDRGASNPELRVNLSYNLAITHLQLGDLTQARWAMMDMRNAGACWESPPDEEAQRHRQRILAYAENTEGLVLIDCHVRNLPVPHPGNLLAEARAHIHTALLSFQDLGMTAETATAMLNLGLVAALERQWVEADDFLAKGLDLARESGRNRLIALGLVQQGRSAFWQAQWDKARVSVEAARPLAERGNYFDLQFLCYFYLWKLEERRRTGDGVRLWLEKLEGTRPLVAGTLIELCQYDTRPDGRKRRRTGR